MMVRCVVYGILVIFICSLISGCETVPKRFKEEVGGIKTRVEALESRVDGIESKQLDTERPAGEQVQFLDETQARGAHPDIFSLKDKERVKEIQTCLKNAGFYDGKIDGISGKNTRRAIREFQKANGLVSDGVVGKKTWEVLSKHATGGEGATK